MRTINYYKCYPALKDEKELSLLACIAWTMKDFDWHIAPAEEVQARKTKNLSLEESDSYKLVDAAPPKNLLPLDEYNDILSRLISTKILEQKIIPTKNGSPSGERLENEEYLVFTNDDMTNEILRNSEVLDLAIQDFLSSMDVGKMGEYKKLTKNDLYIWSSY
jgi:hypothetical protein